MNFDGLLQRVRDSFTSPSILANIVKGQTWNQDLPRFGGVAPESQMVQNPNVASPLQAPDEVTPGLEHRANFEDLIASQKGVLGTQSPPVPSPTPPPDEAALPYYKQINQSAAENNVPQDYLYRLLKTESMGFNPDVVYGRLNSPVGAQGIGQFMPSTSAGMGFDPLNPNEAIPQSAKYLRAKYDEGGDDWALALARYNAGSGNVQKYGGVPPFPETQNYVKRILGR